MANDNSVASIGKDLQQLLFKGCGVTVNLPVLHQRLGADGGTANHDSDAQRGGELPAVRLKGAVSDCGGQRENGDKRRGAAAENRRRADAGQKSGRL